MNPALPAPPAGYSLTEEDGRIRVVRTEDDEALGPFMRRSFGELCDLPDARRIASGRAGPVHLPVPGFTNRILVRPFAHGGTVAPLRAGGFPNPSRGLAELAVNAKAAGLGLPVVPLVGLTAARRPDGRWDMEAWSWWMTDSLTLSHCLPSLAASAPARQALLTAVGTAIRQCHDAGLVHADLNARNILVSRAPDSWRVGLIDLDRARFQARLDLGARLAQIRRLYRSLAKEGVIPDCLPAEDLPGFVRECAGFQLPDAGVAAFLARCRRAVFWHSLLWRLAGRSPKPPPA